MNARGRQKFPRPVGCTWRAVDGRPRESLSELESKLDPEKLLRTHRSSIVNLDRVKEMHPRFGGEYAVLLHDGTELKLSRTRREHLQRLLEKQ